MKIYHLIRLPVLQEDEGRYFSIGVFKEYNDAINYRDEYRQEFFKTGDFIIVEGSYDETFT